MIRPVTKSAGPILLVLLPGGPAAHAGIGSGARPPAVIDTRPPEAVVARATAGTLFQGGQTVTFTYSARDDHPGPDPGDHLVFGLDGVTVLDSVPFAPGPGGESWDWMLPEIASARVKVRVRATDAFGNVGLAETPDFTVIPSVTDVPVPGRAFRLGPATPNPFNPRVSFALELPGPGFLSVRVYDARGRLTRRLVDGDVSGSRRVLDWDGTDSAGRRAAAGTYLLRVEFRSPDGTLRRTRKAVLLP